MSAVYELINPSDAASFETDDEEALCVGVIFIGKGRYGLDSEGRKVLGLALFGIGAEEMAERVDGFMKTAPDARARVAAALRTVLYCSESDRKALGAAFEGLPEDQRLAAMARFNDSKRSSINDIGKRCLAVASALSRGES
jgi:hypothetical protein